MNEKDQKMFDSFINKLEKRTQTAVSRNTFITYISYVKKTVIEEFNNIFSNELSSLIHFIEYKIIKESKNKFGFKFIRDNINRWLKKFETIKREGKLE